MEHIMAGKCPVCGFTTEEASCPRCATILLRGQAICPKCGKMFEGRVAVCDACGAGVAGGLDEAAGQGGPGVPPLPRVGEGAPRPLVPRGLRDFPAVIQ